MNHSQEFLALIESARKNVRELAVTEYFKRRRKDTLLIDVREDNEWNTGHAPEAIHLGRGILERDIVQTVPDKTREIVLYCRGGMRSILAAEALQRMGYEAVYSLTGGWRAWLANGGESVKPKQGIGN